MDPVAFTIFGVDIMWYAIMIVTGMLLGMLVAAVLFRRKGFKADMVIDFAILVLPLAIIGARFYYIIFSDNPSSFWTMFTFWRGISWWGTILGFVIFAAVGLLIIRINPLKFCRIRPFAEGDKRMPAGARDWAIWSVFTVALTLIFGRIIYCFLNDPTSSSSGIYHLFNIRGGGLAIYGGVIGGAIGVFAMCRIKKFTWKQIRAVCDSIAPALILGQAIGRWGNFFNQEAYGEAVTDPAWQFFPFAVWIEDQDMWYQATFFYEFLVNIIGFAILFAYSYNKSHKYDGMVTCLYFIRYGIGRAIIEGFRSDSLWTPGELRVSQLLSVILLTVFTAVALAVLWKDLSLAEQRTGLICWGFVLVSGILWFIAEQGGVFSYSIWTMLGVAMLPAGVGAAVLCFWTKRRMYGYLSGALIAVGVVMLCAAGLLSWWFALAGAVIGLGVEAANLILNRGPKPEEPAAV